MKRVSYTNGQVTSPREQAMLNAYLESGGRVKHVKAGGSLKGAKRYSPMPATRTA